MVASGAAVLAMAAPAAATTDSDPMGGRVTDRVMSQMCEMMMQDRPGMEQMREAMMRAMAQMHEMMMRHHPEVAEKCMSMMDGSSQE